MTPSARELGAGYNHVAMARRRQPESSARRALLALVLAGPLLFQATSGSSQQAGAQTPRATFEESVNVKVINVLVYVRDKEGNAVAGLTRDDFILKEDKRPVPISNFYEVRNRVKYDEVQGLVPDEPEVVFQERPGLERRRRVVPEDERLYLVVYVDHHNIRPHNRNRLFRYVREFLRQHVTREDRVMLVTFNRSVKVERDFTGDPQLIANALYELEEHTGGRTGWDSDRSDLIRDIGEEDRSHEFVLGRVRIHAQQIYNDMQFTLDGLKDTVVSLAGLPGRKAFLYISDGLPMRAGADMFEAMDQRARAIVQGYESNFFLDSLQYDSSRRFTDLVNTANSNEISFYSIDASGPMGINSRDASMQGMAFSSNIDSVARDNMQSTIMYMADETGGQYIVNTNNFRDGLNRIALDFTNYYSLGFQPGHAGTGRIYDIKVELTDEAKNRLGLRRDRFVRHRLTYRDKSIDTEMEEGTLAALKLGYEKNDLEISLVKADEIRREERGLYTVHVDVRIPIDEMTLVPVGTVGEHLLRARVWVQALATNGDLSQPQVEPFELTIPEGDLERARESYYTYTLPLIMKEGDQRLTVAVRDEVAGQTSFVTRTLRVGA